jgi:hypothetical protein
MKLDIPFFKQTTNLNCGPAALRMTLAYLDKDPGIELMEEKVGIQEGKGTSTMQLGIATAKLGHKTELFSKYTSFNEENLELDFYKKYSESDLEYHKNLEKSAEQERVKIIEKTFSLELSLLLTENSAVIILLDWNVVKGKEEKGYQGHFVPVVGYDEENIYVHDHGLSSPQPLTKIKKEIFDKARKAKGTDEDVLVIHRKA